MIHLLAPGLRRPPSLACGGIVLIAGIVALLAVTSADGSHSYREFALLAGFYIMAAGVLMMPLAAYIGATAQTAKGDYSARSVRKNREIFAIHAGPVLATVVVSYVLVYSVSCLVLWRQGATDSIPWTYCVTGLLQPIAVASVGYALGARLALPWAPVLSAVVYGVVGYAIGAVWPATSLNYTLDAFQPSTQPTSVGFVTKLATFLAVLVSAVVLSHSTPANTTFASKRNLLSFGTLGAVLATVAAWVPQGNMLTLRQSEPACVGTETRLCVWPEHKRQAVKHLNVLQRYSAATSGTPYHQAQFRESGVKSPGFELDTLIAPSRTRDDVIRPIDVALSQDCKRDYFDNAEAAVLMATLTWQIGAKGASDHEESTVRMKRVLANVDRSRVAIPEHVDDASAAQGLHWARKALTGLGRCELPTLAELRAP